ncbi:MAG: hypothetical protein [Bacteriophage sp.]|nr:MAG: hypothetical protein [Bacteriophage sp.]
MTDQAQAPVVDNTLAPVAPGAFGAPKEGTVPVADLPQDKLQSTLDDILNAARGGKGPEQAADAPVVSAVTSAPKPGELPGAEAEVPETGAPAAVEPTGNKALDIAVSAFVKSTGMTEADITSAMSKAYETGKVEDIDRAFLKERFGDNAESAIGLAEAVMEHELAARDSLLKSVFDVAGGEAQFKAASDVFSKHADADTKAAIRQMLDSNNPSLIKYAAGQIVQFSKQTGVVPQQQGSKFVAGASFSEASGLSKAEFQAAVVQLQANPSRRTYQQDMARLMELRKIGVTLGK